MGGKKSGGSGKRRVTKDGQRARQFKLELALANIDQTLVHRKAELTEEQITLLKERRREIIEELGRN